MMFCNQCGLEISDDSKFCLRCGHSVARVVEKATTPPLFTPSATRTTPVPPPATPDAGAPQFVLRPRFVGLFILPSLPVFAIFGIVAAVVLSAIVSGLLYDTGPQTGLTVFFGCLFCVGVPVLAYGVQKMTYMKTEYRFYRDRLEYTEGFWTIENKTIRYDRITEMTMRQGVLQKACNMGTIFLSTPATGHELGKAASGIDVKDIESPENVYAAIQKLIGVKTAR